MNHKQPGRHEPPAWPAGNLGLGLCYSCVSEHWLALARRTSAEGTSDQGPVPRPRYAITLAPSPKPVMGPTGEVVYTMLVTLPTCLEHLGPRQQAPARQQAQRRPAPAAPTGRRWDRANVLP